MKVFCYKIRDRTIEDKVSTDSLAENGKYAERRLSKNNQKNWRYHLTNQRF